MRAASAGRTGPLLVLVLLAALYMVGVWRHAGPEGLPHFDTYAYFVPNARYAADSLAQGHGLLWNRFQNCGEPFFAISPTGLLYPPQALALALDTHLALRALFFLHLVIAGIGMYALCRALAVTRAAALCGALAFEFGANTLWTAYWSPSILAVYAWMPVALALTERLLRRPSLPGTLLLGVVLTLQLLVGYPQVLLFTYQLIALRLAWEAATNWHAPLARAGIAIVAALALAPLLSAVQLVPSLEVAAQSIRSRPLTLEEIRPAHVTLTWAQFREWVGRRYAYGALFTVSAVMLASLGLLHGARRRVVFYLLAAVAYFLVAFDTPLFHLYLHLPLGRTFREPHRFLWVTAVVGCVVVAAGADAIVRGARPRRLPALVLAAPVLAAIAFAVLSPTRLRAVEIGLGALLVGLVAVPPGRARFVVAAGLPLLLGGQLLVDNWWQLFAYVRDDTILMQRRPAFAAVRERATLQDRAYPMAAEKATTWQGLFDGMIKKSGQLFGVPSIVDYELQVSARYAGLLVQTFMGKPMTSFNQFTFVDLAPKPASRPLFDLLATRYVVADAERADKLGWPSGPDFALVWAEGKSRVYENLTALPRAFFVPQARAAGEADAVLEALAAGRDDPRRVALLEGSTPTPLGTPDARGSAEIDRDTGEVVSIRVQATAPGFLFLADQYYPGWRATVDGRPASIQRANYAFRLVEVPAGTSVVRFEYRPRSVLVGAAISAATVTLVAIVLARRRRQAQPTPPGVFRDSDPTI
jgi:hypothetical protein